MMPTRTAGSLFRALCLCLLAGSLGLIAPVSAQPARDVEELLERFDGRVGEVRDLVDASRDPLANQLLQSAISFRNQAEGAFRTNDVSRARELAIRALETLDKAQRQALSTPGSGALEKIERILRSTRQNLEDTRRRLRDIEDRLTTPAGGQGAPFIERQSETTLQLIEEAEENAESTEEDRDDDLAERARTLFDQAQTILPERPNTPAGDSRFAESRVQEVRNILDDIDQQLDRIEREVNQIRGKGESIPGALVGSIETRLRNLGRQINRANDQLDLVDSSGVDRGPGVTNTVLGLLRRASELARQSLRSSQTGSERAEEFQRRDSAVGGLADQVESLIQDSSLPAPLEYQQALDLRDQANQAADDGNYELAMRLISDAATRLNRVLAQLGANRTVEARLEILNRLQSEFDRRFGQITTEAGGPQQGPCETLLVSARAAADRSELLEQSRNIEGAFQSINTAQRNLEEAATCLGISTSRVQTLLDRLQAEYDRRRNEINANLPADPPPIATVLLAESANLRELSDTQEGQGLFETAVQTIGRALTTLGNVQRLLFSSETENDTALLDRIQGQFDGRYPQVEALVESSENEMAATSLVESARLRGVSDQSESAGRIRAALNEMGLAIQHLEQATLAALGRLPSGTP